ncbi:hypothetical protein [Glycomyces niveus]|nr:hypothetical protein [Glycomyces sp. NEAU-S30]
MKANWGQPWRDYPAQWRDDFEERAYRAYVSRTAEPHASVRVCEG